MELFLCDLWPYLAGGLIGWLLAGWFARHLKHSESVEKIVEKEVVKVVDNPEHLGLISKLEGENSQLEVLRARVNRFLEEKQTGNFKERKVVKIVDNPEHLGLISKLQSENGQLEKLRSRINRLLEAKGNSVDKADHLALLSQLEEETKQVQLLESKISDSESQGSTATEVRSDSSESPARINEESESSSSFIELDTAAAKAAGFKLKQKNGQDDFTLIEGIGPKINDLIHADGIHTFAELSTTLVDEIQKILDDAGSNYKLAKPGTWPAQAEMAATNRWDTLKAWQDELDGGK